MSDESAENIWSGKSLELRTLSTALPPVLKVFICQKTVNAVTSSDEARRDFIKGLAATEYVDFWIFGQPHLAALKCINEYVHERDSHTSLRAEIVPLNNAREEVNTHSSIDLKPILSPECIDWESYDKYIFPAGHYKIVKNESGQICGQLHPILGLHEYYDCQAICKCPKHAGRCSRQRSWKVRYGEAPQMLDRVLACWLAEGASHVSTAKHMASHRY